MKLKKLKKVTKEKKKYLLKIYQDKIDGERFYSPLVKSMASKEGIEMNELESIAGTGKEGKVTKADMINYLKIRQTVNTKQNDSVEENKSIKVEQKTEHSDTTSSKTVSVPNTGDTEIIEMDRMRKLSLMTMSKQTSAHILFCRSRYDKHS